MVLLPYRFTLFSNAEMQDKPTPAVLLPYRFTLFSNLHVLFTCGADVLLPYRFTLFSNYWPTTLTSHYVLLPYRFTLFSNLSLSMLLSTKVLLPYRFTLFSNDEEIKVANHRFYYLIDLHYSQTSLGISEIIWLFYYLIDLHYSQTSNLKLGIKCTHYTVHGKSIRLFYNICIMIVNKIRTNHYQSQQGVPCCNPAWMFS